MNIYRKILIGKKSEKNLCFSNNDEWLVIAPLEEKKLHGLSEEEHYFVGVDSKKPSRYGWIKSIDSNVTAEELARRFAIQPTKEMIMHCEKLLRSISELKDDTPMACSYSEFGILAKKRELEIHRIIFYDT